MLGWRTLLAATLLALPFWAVGAPRAHACTCGIESLDERVSAADLIVIGTPTELRLLGPVPTVEPLSPPDVGRVQDGGPPAELDLDVHEYIKGAGPSTLTVYESGTTVVVSPGAEVEVRPRSSAACGTFDNLGVRYLLFLYRLAEGLYSGGVCGGSTAITAYNQAESRVEEVRQVLQAQVPNFLPDTGSGPSHRDPTVWPLVAAGALGAALGAAALFAFRPAGTPPDR